MGVNLTSIPYRSCIKLAAILLLISLGAAHEAAAADPAATGDDASASKQKAIRLEEVQVNEARTSADTMAIADSSLDALQPESIVSMETIQNNIPPTADYALIANLTPSVSTFSTNGPGLNEAKVILRGWVDGQYNVTFDGIPFGDGNDFTHHSNSYFPAKIIGQEVVDRGPGTASTIGMATFGGTIAMFSKDPTTQQNLVATLSYGSWHTQLENLEVNTGILANGGSLVASYQYLSSNGYRSFGTIMRNTYYVKYLQPISKNTNLTVLGEYNNIKFNNPNDSTPTYQQLVTLGRNFGQTNNPLDPNGDDYMRNHQEKHTDMDYIGLDTTLDSGWEMHEKLYTFNYDNHSHESPNQNAGPSKTDPGGQVKVNVNRAYGTYFQAIHEDSFGVLKAGFWFDYQHGPRYNYYYDEFNPAAGPVVQYNYLDLARKGSTSQPDNGGYAWNMHYWTRTWQPYIEYNYNVTTQFSIDPGLKYLSVNRSIYGPVNQSKEAVPQPFSYDETFSQVLPLVSANYKFTKDWSAYAQYAKGFLTPALKESSIANPQLNQKEVQNTTNYQIGTVYKTHQLNADFDAYYIHYTNLPVTTLNPAEIPGTPGFDSKDVIYYFASGARYYGVEGEATLYVGDGFSAFANASRNYGIYDGAKRRIEATPQSTAGFGFIFDRGGFNASLIAKYIGPYIIYTGSPSDPTLPLPAGAFSVTQGGYTLFDLSAGYGFKFANGNFIKSVKLRMQLTNLTNRDVRLLSTYNANPLLSQYNVLTPRAVFFTVAGEF